MNNQENINEDVMEKLRHTLGPIVMLYPKETLAVLGIVTTGHLIYKGCKC